MSRIDELLDAAQKTNALTPSPWRSQTEFFTTGDMEKAYDARGREVACGDSGDSTVRYIALADPQTVMALVDAYRAMKQYVEQGGKHDGPCPDPDYGPYEGCEKHVETADRHNAVARAAIERVEGLK